MTANTLNKAGVADLEMTMSGHVKRGDIPGVVTLIGRGDEIHVNAIRVKTRVRAVFHPAGVHQGEVA